MRNDTILNARYWLRKTVARQCYPSYLLAYGRRFREHMVTRRSEVMIDGFPRSGNSFFLTLFEHWNPEVRIAHHVHAPGQIARAVNLEIPTLVLIRRPADALASLWIFKPNLSVDLIIRSYIEFYESLLPIKDRFVTVDFESVTKTPDAVIAKLNSSFGSSFHMEHFDERQKGIIFSTIEDNHKKRKRPALLLAIPDEAREREKAKHRIYETIKARRSYSEAEDIYSRFLETVSKPVPEAIESRFNYV